jgi:hypothetical protein
MPGQQQAAGQIRTIPIELRVLFEHGGYCRVSLLLRRSEGLPEECALSTAIGSIDIIALSEDWYQDVVPEGLGTLLRDGFVWTDKLTQKQWQLAGREIYILATGTTHRGFVSAQRLAIGREHLVMCTTSRLPEVEKVLEQAGCTGWTQFGKDDGAPDGWAILGDAASGRIRGIVPSKPVSLAVGADILNILRPLPEIEIALERGIPLGYNSWLVGHPPEIRIYGDSQHAQGVFIDGHQSTLSQQNAYTAQGWDDPGIHQIWCNGTSKKYSLIHSEPTWKPWAAYSFPLPFDVHSNDRITICGPLVRASIGGEPLAGTQETFSVPPNNPVLIGAIPGQVMVANPRADIRGAEVVVSPPFVPVWALPAQPLRCDKSKNRILFLGGAVVPGAYAQDKNESSVVALWCRLILDTSRKGLVVEPLSLAAAELWDQYKRRARTLWRRNR